MDQGRLRIDLEGVELKDANGRVVCVMRQRTTAGLTLRLPESVDVEVPFCLIADATLDLVSGKVAVGFVRDARRELTWLQAGDRLFGEWTDRHLLQASR